MMVKTDEGTQGTQRVHNYVPSRGKAVRIGYTGEYILLYNILRVPSELRGVNFELFQRSLKGMKMRQGTSNKGSNQSKQPVLEEIIQAQIVQYLQSLRIFRHSVPNEAAGTNAVKTMQLISMGLWAGAGDLIVWWPLVPDWYGYSEDPASSLPTYPVQLGYVEVKRPGLGVQSPKQQSFERRCNRHSVPYILAYGVDDIKAELERRGLATSLPVFLPN